MFTDAAEAAGFAGFSAGPPPITTLSEPEAVEPEPEAVEPELESVEPQPVGPEPVGPEPAETEASAWEVDAEAPVVVGSSGFADDASASASTVDLLTPELAAWDGVFASTSQTAEVGRHVDAGTTSQTFPTDSDHAASVAASWIPRRVPSRAPTGTSVFSGPAVPPPLGPPAKHEPRQPPPSGSVAQTRMPPPAEPPAPPPPAERPSPSDAAAQDEEAAAGEAGAGTAEAGAAPAGAAADAWLGPEPLEPREPEPEIQADAQPADRWWIEPDEVEEPEPQAQARPEPEPVDSIGASFGVWYPPASPPERPRALAPLTRVDGSEAEPTGQHAAPAVPSRALSALRPTADSAASGDAPGTEAPENDAAGTHSDGGRVLSTLVDRPASTSSPLAAHPAPEGQRQARSDPSSVGTATSVTGAAPTSRDADVRSPVVAVVLTLLAVLVVVVIVLGFLYMFTNLL